MTLDEARYVVIDLETTGLSPAVNRITEIAMLEIVDGELGDSYSSLLDPEQYIPPFIAEYTGITNAMVFEKPTFAAAAREIGAFLNRTPNTIIVGHNVSFDHGFLQASFARCGAPFLDLSTGTGFRTLCTCRLTTRLVPGMKKRSLGNVAAYFGIKIRARHRAMGDAEATAKVLLRYLELAADEHEIEEIDDLLKLQNRRPVAKQPVPKVTQKLEQRIKEEFPDRPGVYTMLNRTGEIVYVGKAKNLRQRVSSHFTNSAQTASAKTKRMIKVVRDVTYEETGSELSALLLESRKIKELRPQFNSLDRRYRNYAFLKLSISEAYPALSAVREPAADGADYYGPFRYRSSVEALIEILNRKFKLRECGDKFKIVENTRPCFYYDIERCLAPCTAQITTEVYGAEVTRLQEFLAQGESGILAAVEGMMLAAAEQRDFEEAQFLKIRWLELKKILGTGQRPVPTLNAKDLVLIEPIEEGKQLDVFFVRFGRLLKQARLDITNLPLLEQWLVRQLRHYYSDGVSAIPPQCSKPEIDEMRLLGSWIEHNERGGGRTIYVAEDHTTATATIAQAIKEELKGGCNFRN